METVENRFKGRKLPKTVMINNWIDENEIYPLDENNEKVLAFKKKYGLDGKFVIMYFAAFFSPWWINLEPSPDCHFSRCQSMPPDVKSWTTFFTNKFEKRKKK